MSDRFQRIQDLFEEALSLEPSTRSAYLTEACEGDTVLMEEVLSLLAEEDTAAALFDGLSEQLINPMLNSVQPTPTRIGAYKILKPLGRGGMGSVYLAERTDGIRLQVAIKILRKGLDSEDILRRFRAERQILAKLDHPHIAKFFDGGMTEDGVPYFVMEYVDGLPLNQFCETQKADLETRIRLFRMVCSAVQFSHENLIVHRDIKPSNILVTAEGQAKLLDFGIAKVLSNEQLAITLPTTQFEQRVMTPEYASPEQIRGDAITTSSDVYQLGVLLYELLTGHWPYVLSEKSRTTVEQAVLNQMPVRPSEATNRLKTAKNQAPDTDPFVPPARQLRGDLDTIVMMALRKEPQRRYRSAEQLSEDLRCYLEGLPVSAQPDSARYWLKKFLGRNRVAVGVAALTGLFILAFTGFYIRQTQRERDQAQEVAAFFTNLYKIKQMTSLQGNLSLENFLDRGYELLQNSFQQNGEARAHLLWVLGKAYLDLGLNAKAEPLLRDALKLRYEINGLNHPETARALNEIASLAHFKSDYAQADSLVRIVMKVREKTLPADDPLLADAALHLAAIVGEPLNPKYNPDEALMLYQKAIKGFEIHAAYERERLVATKNRSNLFNNTGRFQEGKETLLGVLAKYESSTNRAAQPLADVYLGLATSETGLENYEAAFNYIHKAIQERMQFFGLKSIKTLGPMRRLADAYAMFDYDQKADSLLNEIAELQIEVLSGPSDLTGRLRMDQALSQIHTRPKQAELTYMEGYKMMQLKRPLKTHEDLYMRARLGYLQVCIGKQEEGLSYLTNALSAFKTKGEQPEWYYSRVQLYYGYALALKGDYAAAEKEMLESYRWHEARKGEFLSALIPAKQMLYTLYMKWGRPDMAAAYYVKRPKV